VTDGPPFVRGDSLSEMIDDLYYPLDKRRLMSFMVMSLATHGVVSHASPPPQTRSNANTALCILLILVTTVLIERALIHNSLSICMYTILSCPNIYNPMHAIIV
jgi:hypothetical protein